MVISSYHHDIIISSYRHITISYHHHVLAGSSTHWMSFLVKVQGKIRNRPFYPSSKSRIELKFGSSGVIFRDGSASDAQNFIALPKHALCFFVLCFQQKSKKILVFDVETWNVGKHLKRVLAKFQANPSHPRGVNGRSKISKSSQNSDFLTVEKWNVGDRPKRVLAKFEADRSHVRGVNGRSKFRKNFETRKNREDETNMTLIWH